jgi:hypothetical protein
VVDTLHHTAALAGVSRDQYRSAVNREQAKRLAPLFDPLLPADPLLYVARPEPPISALREAWAFGPAEGHHCLLVGGLGSGKSTELMHLAVEVAQEADAPLVTLLRLQEQLDPGQVTAAQVLFLLGAASLALVTTAAPSKIVSGLEKAYADIVEPDGAGKMNVPDLVSRIAVLAGGMVKATGRPLVGELVSGLGSLVSRAKPPRLPLPGKGLRLSANQTPVTNLSEAVADAIAWTRKEYIQTPLAFFVDGLDRLDPASIDEIFGSGVLSLPPAPVVYSAPLALRYTVKGIALEPHYSFLTVHNFPVFDKHEHDRPNPEAFAAMRELVLKRLDRAQLEPMEVFADGLAEGTLVDAAIEVSGGVAQTLLDLLDGALRRAVVSARKSGANVLIDASTLDNVIDEGRKRIALRVRPSQWEVLRRVYATSERPEGDAADELLYYNVVLAYPNDPAWFRPSPLLRRYLEDAR